MKNLQEIKEKYAIEQGYEDWGEFSRNGMRVVYDMEMHMDEICIRSQKVALEKAAENVKMGYTSIFSNDMKLVVDRTSITNPENLIR